MMSQNLSGCNGTAQQPNFGSFDTLAGPTLHAGLLKFCEILDENGMTLVSFSFPLFLNQHLVDPSKRINTLLILTFSVVIESVYIY